MKRIKTIILSGAMLMAALLVINVGKARATTEADIPVGKIATIDGFPESVAGQDAFKVYDASGKYWGKLICTFTGDGVNSPFVMTACKLELSNGTITCALPAGGVEFAPIPMGAGQGVVAFPSDCTGTGNLKKVTSCICRMVFDMSTFQAVLGTCYLMEDPNS